MMGCHKALHRQHVPVDFIDISQLEAGKAGRYEVLYLPYCYALSAKSTAAIREFVRNGGTIWADGLVGWKNEQGITRQFPPGPLSDVFGFTVEDIQAAWDPFSLTDKNDLAGQQWRCRIPKGKGEALLTDPEGRPAAIEHRFGAGRAIYYGTALTLSYMQRGTPQMAEWIAAPAVEASRAVPICMVTGSDRISFRALEAPGGVAAVLNNWGAESRATVRFPTSTKRVVDIVSGESVPLQNGEAELLLKAGASAVLIG